MVDFEIDTPTCWRVLFTWFIVVMGFLFTMEMIHVPISRMGCSVQFSLSTCCLFTVKFSKCKHYTLNHLQAIYLLN